jgi:hypothetical protein
MKDYEFMHEPTQGTEKLLTLREVSQVLSVPLFAVRRAAKKGEFPLYCIGNGRRRTRLSEVIAAIERRAKQEEVAQALRGP